MKKWFYTLVFIQVIPFLIFLGSCKKNIIEQDSLTIPTAASFLTYTAQISSNSQATEIFQMEVNGSNILQITNANNISNRFNHNSIFTGYNSLVFTSDSISQIPQTTLLYRYVENPVSIKKLDSGSYKDQFPSYSNFNNILAFVRDTAVVDTGVNKVYSKLPNRLYVYYFNKGILVGLTNFASGRIGHSSWSLDGSTLYFDYTDSTQIPHIYSVPLAGGTPNQITKTPYGEAEPSVSPDGKSLAFSLFINPTRTAGAIGISGIDGSNPKQITNLSSTSLAHEPSWDPSGTLFYFSVYDPTKPGIPSHIFSSSLDGSKITQITSGNGETSPQASKIAFPF